MPSFKYSSYANSSLPPLDAVVFVDYDVRRGVGARLKPAAAIHANNGCSKASPDAETTQFLKRGINLDFSELPSTVTEFYTLLGFPDYLAERAAGDAEANAASPSEIDMWTLHPGVTYALIHFFQGKEGTSLDQYVRIANDILFNPEDTIERVEQAYEQQLEADSDDRAQASLAGERALASIERVSDYLQERVDQFGEREDALRERFQEAMS